MADENRIRCTCPYCRLRSLMGPVIIVTVGVLFLIAQFSRYSFVDRWPVLLIVIWPVLVAQQLDSRQGHISSGCLREHRSQSTRFDIQRITFHLSWRSFSF